MDISNFGYFRIARINDHKQFIRILAKFGKHTACPWCMMAHHRVPPHSQQHIRFVEVGGGVKGLVAIGFFIRPKPAGQLLSKGIVIVLRTQSTKLVNGKEFLRYAADCAAPIKAKERGQCLFTMAVSFSTVSSMACSQDIFSKVSPIFFNGYMSRSAWC